MNFRNPSDFTFHFPFFGKPGFAPSDFVGPLPQPTGIKAFFTMNGQGGLMSKLVGDGKRNVFTWCAWDMVEKCTADCKGCSLSGDCRRKAHNADGFVPVSDPITMHARVQKRTWRYEVLCNPADGASAGSASAGSGLTGSGLTVRHY